MKPKLFMTGSTGYVATKFVELYGGQLDILGISRTDKKYPVDLLNFKAVEKTYNQFQPDYILHMAADVGRDVTTSETIKITNPAITANLIKLAKVDNTPFIFTSTEAVYGGKENVGDYVETDMYQPRSSYGASKVASEKLLIESGLPYLITRGHRHVGISKNFHKPKQFTDTLNELVERRVVHTDSKKLFNPVLINHACEIFKHYISNDADKQLILNIGTDKTTSYYIFMHDVAEVLGIDPDLVKPDGEESGWPQNASLSVEKLKKLKYPTMSYEQLLQTIKQDFLYLQKTD